MTTNPNYPARNLAEYLADARDRGFTVARRGPTTYDLFNAYDPDDDLVITIDNNDTFTVKAAK